MEQAGHPRGLDRLKVRTRRIYPVNLVDHSGATVGRPAGGLARHGGEAPDFGTYHHSSPSESSNFREIARDLFLTAFETLPFSREDEIEVLDIGCGMGFLSCLAAEYYRRANVTGVDTFEHASLKNSSLRKAERNARILGLSDRVAFHKGDILFTDFARKFDLLVSNLVFHNLGKKRIEGYRRIARWSTPESYVLIGDIFFNYKADRVRLSGLFGSVTSVPVSADGALYRILVMSEPKKKF